MWDSTPNNTTGVTGTEVEIEYDPDTLITTIQVIEGTVESYSFADQQTTIMDSEFGGTCECTLYGCDQTFGL